MQLELSLAFALFFFFFFFFFYFFFFYFFFYFLLPASFSPALAPFSRCRLCWAPPRPAAPSPSAPGSGVVPLLRPPASPCVRRSRLLRGLLAPALWLRSARSRLLGLFLVALPPWSVLPLFLSPASVARVRPQCPSPVFRPPLQACVFLLPCVVGVAAAPVLFLHLSRWLPFA